MDADHQATVDLINQAELCDDAELSALINGAFTHLQEHFGREEELMDACGFFASHCHKAEHERVLDEALQIVKAAAEGDLVRVRSYLTKDFAAWLVQHADTMDTVTMAAYRAYQAKK